LVQTAHGTILVPGNAATALAAPNPNGVCAMPTGACLTFSQPVTARALDRADGVFYVGLANQTSSDVPTTLAPAATYAVSKAMRTPGSSTTQFVPIATNALLTGMGIDFLSLATTTTKRDLTSNLAIVLVNGTNYL